MGLIRMLVLALLAALAYTVYRRITGPIQGREKPEVADERLARLVQDPNCHVYVDPLDAVGRKVPDGELFFCSETCAKAYLKERGPEEGS